MNQLDAMALVAKKRLADALDAEVESSRAVAKEARGRWREDLATLTEELVKWVEAKRGAFRVGDQESFKDATDHADSLRDHLHQKLRVVETGPCF